MSADRVVQAAEQAAHYEGQWPPHVVLGHLAMNDTENWSPRIALMVKNHRDGLPGPVFTWFEPEGDEVARRFADFSVSEAAAALMASRTALIGQLRDLDAADWEAVASHDIFGALDVRELVLRLLAHDEGHRGDMLLGPDV